MTSIGKRLLLFSLRDSAAGELADAVAPWRCRVKTCATLDELRGEIEGGDYDFVLVEDSSGIRELIAEDDAQRQAAMPLAEIEKRHIFRVLASTGGNKTHASRILGIDTKTLYNKLKIYSSAAQSARKRGADSSAGAS